VIAHSRRPRELFEAIERYQRLLMSRASLRLEVEGAVARFCHPGEDLPVARPAHMDDFVVAQWVLRLRRRMRGGFPLRKVTFVHAAPSETHEYERLFQAPVEFGAGADAIEFDAALLDVELDGADPTLVRLLRQHAEALLARAPEPDSVVTALRSHLAQAPPDEVGAVVRAARALGTSERSLQRKLRDEGTSFKEVLDGVRRDLALSYLRDARHSVSDVAFLVGFAEASAFSRAFRRWTDTTPATWRRTAPALAAPAKNLAAPGKTPGAHEG
jgi:AraC-like DNA-binding protein